MTVSVLQKFCKGGPASHLLSIGLPEWQSTP